MHQLDRAARAVGGRRASSEHLDAQARQRGAERLRELLDLPKAKLGTFDSELAEVFFEGFAREARANLHVHKLEGHNLHHLIEITFKAFAKALRQSTTLDPKLGGLPSTKGSLD
jgi:imidazoleglycerol phosphate dehydratase HisB